MTSSKQKQSSIKTKESSDNRKFKRVNVSQETNESFAKSEKKVSVNAFSNNTFNTFHDRYKQRSTTNFREVADRKKRNEKCCSILPHSNSNSPSSWYIPSDPPSRSQSNNSIRMPSSRQNSVETDTSPPPQMSSKENQTSDLRARASSVSTHPHSFGWTGHSSRGSKARHFGQMYPSRQASQDSDIPPPNQCRGIQTGSSLLRMYMKKVTYSRNNMINQTPLSHRPTKVSRSVMDLRLFFFPWIKHQKSLSSLTLKLRLTKRQQIFKRLCVKRDLVKLENI